MEITGHMSEPGPLSVLGSAQETDHVIVLARMNAMLAGWEGWSEAQLAVLPGTTHMNILDRGDWVTPMIEARLQTV